MLYSSIPDEEFPGTPTRPGSPCPQWLIAGGGVTKCGLLRDHDEHHLPWTPGSYLPDPIIHPLDLRLIIVSRRWRCPEGCPISGFMCWEPKTVHVMQGSEWIADRCEQLWLFDPCQHQYREVWPLEPEPYGDVVYDWR